MNEKKLYSADIDAVKREEPDWIRRFRHEAAEKFLNTPFPTIREEDWRFTNVAPLLNIPFRTRLNLPAKITDSVKASGDLDLNWPRLVFVNGEFSHHLSNLQQIEGIRYGSLWELFQKSDSWAEYLGAAIQGPENAFTALNGAFLQGGSAVHVAPRTVLDAPLLLLFITTELEDIAIHPRNLIVAGKGSEFSIIESHIHTSGSRYLSNAVTEVLLQDSAVVEHCKVQQESESGFHISSLHVVQGRDSSYTSFLFTIGAALSRNDLMVKINGEGGSCGLNGLYLVAGNQLADHHTVIDHATPHTSSQELYKGILSGTSRAIFNGRIIVRKNAQKTDARQINKNLLISERARINTKPQLEIMADDVKCNHGATIGHLEEEELFYLRSRGIENSDARRMLMFGFIEEVTARIRNQRLQGILNEITQRRLKQFTERSAA